VPGALGANDSRVMSSFRGAWPPAADSLALRVSWSIPRCGRRLRARPPAHNNPAMGPKCDQARSVRQAIAAADEKETMRSMSESDVVGGAGRLALSVCAAALLAVLSCGRARAPEPPRARPAPAAEEPAPPKPAGPLYERLGGKPAVEKIGGDVFELRRGGWELVSTNLSVCHLLPARPVPARV